jgi:Bacterial SH3 domain
MKSKLTMTVFASAALLLTSGMAAHAAPGSPGDRFRDAGDLVREGDLLKGIAVYRALASTGIESASLYWNWAEAAASRGEIGEALWAALRAREVEPGDRALAREIQRLREAANLDPAEIAPEPLGMVARASRRFHLGLLALVLAAGSLSARALARFLPRSRRLGPVAWAALALSVLVGALPVAGSFARPTAVVVRRGATLFDSASPSASAMGSLRLGEVVPVVERSGAYLRIEDSSGARGWARQDEVWSLDQPPPPESDKPS